MRAPDPPESAPHDDTGRQVMRVLILEGCANLLVLLAKLWVGATTGSLSVMGDALHSAGDLANNAFAIMVVRISRQPPDRDHPYGHRKFETLAVFVLASLLTGLAFELLTGALRASRPPTSSPLALAVMIGALMVNSAVTYWEHRQAKRLRSSLLEADARHTLSDVLVTLSVIVGWQLSASAFPWADRAAAVGVAGVVFVMAYGLFRSAVPILVDAAAIDAVQLMRTAEGVVGVRSVRSARSRWVGPGASVDVVIRVAPELSTAAAHRIADEVEAAIEASFGVVDTTVHVEPHLQDPSKGPDA